MHLRKNLACKKTLGRFRKVLQIIKKKTPPLQFIVNGCDKDEDNDDQDDDDGIDDGDDHSGFSSFQQWWFTNMPSLVFTSDRYILSYHTLSRLIITLSDFIFLSSHPSIGCNQNYYIQFSPLLQHAMYLYLYLYLYFLFCILCLMKFVVTFQQI